MQKQQQQQRRTVLWTVGVIGFLGWTTTAATATTLLLTWTPTPGRTTPCTAKYAHDGGPPANLRDALARTDVSPTPLRDLTPFAWDTVYVVPWRRVIDEEQALNMALGCEAQLPYRADFDLGSVLFFSRDGHVIQTLEVWYNLTDPTNTPTAWSPSATVTRPLDDPSCPRCLTLTEPRPTKRYTAEGRAAQVVGDRATGASG